MKRYKFNYKLQVYPGKKSGWYIRIRTRNGKIVADGGEAYSSKYNAERAAKRLVAGIKTTEVLIES